MATYSQTARNCIPYWPPSSLTLIGYHFTSFMVSRISDLACQKDFAKLQIDYWLPFSHDYAITHPLEEHARYGIHWLVEHHLLRGFLLHFYRLHVRSGESLNSLEYRSGSTLLVTCYSIGYSVEPCSSDHPKTMIIWLSSVLIYPGFLLHLHLSVLESL